MATMSISEFKATCLAAIEKVRQTGEPIVITRHGEVVAEVMPPRPFGARFLGRLKDTVDPSADLDKFDLAEPTITADEFERGTLEDFHESCR